MSDLLALTREIDRLTREKSEATSDLICAHREIERHKQEILRLDGVAAGLAGSHARLREENERMRLVYEAAKAYVDLRRRERKETDEINERLNRGETVSWTATVSSTPASLDLEKAVDKALASESAPACGVRVVPGFKFPGPHFVCQLPRGHEGEHRGEIIEETERTDAK